MPMPQKRQPKRTSTKQKTANPTRTKQSSALQEYGPVGSVEENDEDDEDIEEDVEEDDNEDDCLQDNSPIGPSGVDYSQEEEECESPDSFEEEDSYPTATNDTTEDEFESWDILKIPNFANKGEQFILPEVLPYSFPILSKRGNAGFCHNGYLFGCNDEAKKMTTHHYKCEQAECNTKLTTYGVTSFKALTKGNTCFPPEDIIKRLLKWYFRQRQPFNRGISSQEIVTKALANLNSFQKIEVGTIKSLMKYVSDYKRKSDNVGKSATSLLELDVPENLRVTLKDEPFLLHDDGPQQNNRLICFATQRNLELLMEADIWLADGTFSSCPKLFSQLWVIHGKFEEKTIPLVFFLLNGFSEDHYTHALEVLKEKLDALPLEHCEPTKRRRRNQDSGSQGSEETEEPSSEPYHTHLLVDFELAQAKAFTVTAAT